MDKYHKAALEMPRLCPMDLLMKEHKPPTISGLRTRAITSHDNYYTCQISTFLHQVLAPKVFSHQFVLKDSLSFIRMIDTLNTPFNDNLRFATYDVTALYPSIDLERGLKSLEWFLGAECNFNNELSDFILTLSRFVLTRCYISCPEISENIFHQVIGTAMGTSFAVVYAIILMIRIETEAKMNIAARMGQVPSQITRRDTLPANFFPFHKALPSCKRVLLTPSLASKTGFNKR